MAISLDDIQSRIQSVVDQDYVTGNISNSDYQLRLKYINRALQEWGEMYDWQVLYKEYYALVSTSTGNASIALPSDFRKLASPPLITYDGATTRPFPEVRPQENAQYSGTDKRVNILGNPFSSYTMYVAGTSLVSGASVTVPYYSSVGSLATTTDIARIPNPEYLVQRTIAYIWESREDARFPQAKAEAQQILANMIEYENVFGEASTFDRIKTYEETRFGFRIGRD